MTTNRTFTMIKPDAVANAHTGKIIDDILNAGFKIVSMKYIHLTQAQTLINKCFITYFTY